MLETVQTPAPTQEPPEQPSGAAPPTAPEPWPPFIDKSTDPEIVERFASELRELQARHQTTLEQYVTLALIAPADSLDTFEADKIFAALTRLNANRSKDVLLLLLSKGGNIEPAYQISKLCKSISRGRFVALIPRHAKSAATLLALGADEIHMGPLGQLGPIDPQLQGLPALGVVQALKTIAGLAETHPGSADMFARYLRQALTVQQIGYCERISNSAVQYAERLLATKPSLRANASKIANELVYEYKDHGFVIDRDEATAHLGDFWIKSASPELEFAEAAYRLFETVNLWLGFLKRKRILVAGELSAAADSLILGG